MRRWTWLPRIAGPTFMMLLLGACGAPQSTPPPAAPAPTGTPVPTAAEAPKVTITYEEAAQFEIVSPQGNRVLIDVQDPKVLTSPATAQDVLLTTHAHGDHLNPAFAGAFPGQQLRIQEGEITLPDVVIRGIASAHNAPEKEFKPQGGTNYIFILDVGGLRIVHFGDIGQDQLTPQQLSALGTVDVALTQLANSYSDMNIGNKKGFNLMAQVKPRLIIPTHIDLATAKYAVEQWTGYAHQGPVTIGAADLSSGTAILFLGSNGTVYGKIHSLPDWGTP